MAEVLRGGQHGQMEQEYKGHIMGMPQYWVPPPDERDAYIGWLKSEFAAANALIDSMCHHLHSMGGPGEYNLVFGCLNRRRHAWTPALYMQSFFSVAEVVTALEDVAWKRHQCCHGSSIASKACPSCGIGGEEAHADEIQLQPGNHGRSNLHLNSIDSSVIAEAHQIISEQPQSTGIDCLNSSSNKDVNGVHVHATAASDQIAEIVTTSNLPDSAFLASAESCIIGCNKKTYSHSVCKASSMAHICNRGEQHNTEAHANDQARLSTIKGLDVRKLLNTEISIAAREEDARRAIIKRSMQFQCCEHVDGQQINDGESVELCEGVLNDKEIDEIVGIISQLQAAGRQGELGGAFRGCKNASLLPDIIQFGPRKVLSGDATYIPKFVQAIIGWLTSCGILLPKKSPDSCHISIFDEGSFEAPNTDQGAWEKPLCIISLMQDCSMVFGHSISTDQYGSCRGPFQVTLPAGSVLLLRENFSGIFQKAIPASPRRRITIALGKAVSTSKGEVNCVNAAGKMKSKYRGTGGGKQGRLLPDTGAWSHQHPHPLALPHMQFPVPCVQPKFPPGLMLPPPAVVLPRLLGSSSAGTGVFFPSCEATDVSVPTPWQSALLLVSSSSLVASSRSVPSKRAAKHAEFKEASGNLTDAQAPNQKLAPCQVVT